MLDEIDRIISELQNRRGEGPNGTPSSPWAVPYSSDASGLAGMLEGAPTGYFEEHLVNARRAVGNIEEKVEELQSTSATLRQRVSAAESELDRISQEYVFVRDHSRPAGALGEPSRPAPSWSEEDPESSRPGWSESIPALSSGSFTAIHAASTSGSPPVYEGFTVDRYNRTINSIKAGRTKLVILTLALSAAVGIALLALVLYSPIVNPPLWVAALPLVWIIPIPYFLLSFRGTQRVLERNHLNLPEVR
ncbi:MAG TPA: hypothetical protein VEH28_00565 [Thermoplasmata archaeon]|nr:hypothetical protein [Thermoplasmata archaeon]